MVSNCSRIAHSYILEVLRVRHNRMAAVSLILPLLAHYSLATLASAVSKILQAPSLPRVFALPLASVRDFSLPLSFSLPPAYIFSKVLPCPFISKKSPLPALLVSITASTSKTARTMSVWITMSKLLVC